MQERIITTNESGQRLDKYLGKYLKEAPKSFIYKMLRKKNIVLNDKKADGSEKLSEGDRVRFWLSDDTIDKFVSSMVSKVDHHLDIVYEDSNILIINKRAGVLSQKAKPLDVSLNEEVVSYLMDSGALNADALKSFMPSVCNRLDRNTSGLIVAGKSLLGLQQMSAVFKERSLHKYYLTIVEGCLREKKRIQGYLWKDEERNQVYISDTRMKGGDFIETEYEPLKSNGRLTLLNVCLITGRSHQIRAHLSSIGHPLVGDSKYGSAVTNMYMFDKYHLKYQLLHAHRLELPEFTGKMENLSGKTFEAPLPEMFKRIARAEELL